MHHYRAEIDGLRALAIIPVVLFHLGVSGFSGGYLGVDLFFVLSGYLITQIIAKEIHAKQFSIRRFWARRIRRILPVLIMVIVAVLILAQAMAYPQERRYVANQSAAALGFVANWYFLSNIGNYFSPTAEQSVLLHTWSLSVEEQFYLIYPWLLIAIFRFLPRYAPGVVIALMLASLGSFLHDRSANLGSLDELESGIAFYGSHNRGWELLAGATIALMQSRLPTEPMAGNGRLLRALPWMGFALIGSSIFFQWDNTPTDFNAVGIVLGTSILLAVPGSGWIYKALSHTIMVLIGKLSYSIYMWHWPWIVWGSWQLDGRSPLWLLPAIAITSLASHFLIEQPMRGWKKGTPWIVAALALVLIYAIIAGRPGDRNIASNGSMQRPIWNGALYDLSPRTNSGDWIKRLNEAGVIVGKWPTGVPPVDTSMAYQDAGLLLGSSENSPPRWVILGDSHAAMWSEGLKRLAEQSKVPVSLWSIHGVDPFIHLPVQASEGSGVLNAQEKAAYDSARLQKIQQWKPEVVIVAARWLLWPDQAPKELIAFLHQHADHVLIIGVVAESDIGDELVVSYLDSTGYVPKQDGLLYLPIKHYGKLKAAEQQLMTYAEPYDNVTVVPMLDLFGRGEDCLIAIGDQTIYLDDDHLTQFGADLGMERIQSQLKLWTQRSNVAGAPNQ